MEKGLSSRHGANLVEMPARSRIYLDLADCLLRFASFERLVEFWSHRYLSTVLLCRNRANFLPTVVFFCCVTPFQSSVDKKLIKNSEHGSKRQKYFKTYGTVNT